jgi:hypothetical protein
MKFAAIAIAWGLLAQAQEVPDRYRPRVESRGEQRGAPAARIEEPPQEPATAPDSALGAPERESDDRLHMPSRGRGEPLGGSAPAAETAHGKPRPPDILAQALARPAEAALAGKPITLLTAISRSTDRQQQLRIARAYWRLATAQADYHWALDQREKLKHHTQTHTSAPETLSARASARADVRDTELMAAQAQQELADLMGGPAEDGLPLAADRPHVGGYNTYYEEIFSNRAPPARIRLIHRMLPIRRKAIDAHAEAILAADDALEASGEEFQKNGQGLATILAALDQLKRERRIFMAAIRDYNQEIAEYLFAVAPPGTNDKTLVSKLILSTERAAQPTRPRADDRTFTPSEAAEPAGEAAPRGEPERGPARQRTSEYQPSADEPANATPLYLGLMDQQSPARVQKLAELLHWNRGLPPENGRPIPLGECLRTVPPGQRRAMIAAYWQAGEQAARCHVLSEQVDQLTALGALAVTMRDRPGMAEAGVRLQAVRRAARAAMIDAQGGLLSAEFQLTQAAGHPLEDVWLVPETPPASQHELPATAAGGRASPRWAEIVDLQRSRLGDLADAVIEADAGRAALGSQREQPATADEAAPLDEMIWAVTHQTRDTLSFLRGLTEYNLAVADYALAALPATITPDELAKRLLIIAVDTSGGS